MNKWVNLADAGEGTITDDYESVVSNAHQQAVIITVWQRRQREAHSTHYENVGKHCFQIKASS